MAVTQAQLQTAVAFARTNALDPSDMVAIIELALITPFLDASAGIQMVTLSVGSDGVSMTVAWEMAHKLLAYFSSKANGGIVVQKAEFTPTSRYPGQPI